MNRANVKIIMLCCGIAAIVSWLLGYALYRRPAPEELSFCQQYLVLYEFQRTNEVAAQRNEMRTYANNIISNAVAIGDLTQERAAKRLLASVLQKDSSDADALHDLLLQEGACAEGRHQQQLRFVHIAECFCGGILFAAILLFATAPKAKAA